MPLLCSPSALCRLGEQGASSDGSSPSSASPRFSAVLSWSMPASTTTLGATRADSRGGVPEMSVPRRCVSSLLPVSSNKRAAPCCSSAAASPGNPAGSKIRGLCSPSLSGASGSTPSFLLYGAPRAANTKSLFQRLSSGNLCEVRTVSAPLLVSTTFSPLCSVSPAQTALKALSSYLRPASAVRCAMTTSPISCNVP